MASNLRLKAALLGCLCWCFPMPRSPAFSSRGEAELRLPFSTAQVLDYQNVSGELLPLIAAAYALKFMGQVRMLFCSCTQQLSCLH